MSLLYYGGAVLAASMAGLLGYLRYYNYNKASLVYLLYARTPFGRYYHSKLLNQSRMSQPAKGFTVDTPTCLVRTVPFLSDNYAYILLCKATNTAAVVDPADPEVVSNAVVELAKELGKDIYVSTVLTTHYHQDHAGGNREFVDTLQKINQRQGSIQVVGGVNERRPGVQALTHPVAHGDVLQFGKVEVKCLGVPCHTWGSIAFLVDDKLLFSGDYLFSAGCGRFFEGGADDFCDSLERSINNIPDDVLLFPGHEYTLSNLKFAASILPDDEDIKERLKWATERREQGEPTIPSLLADERKINLFLRGGDSKLCTDSLMTRVRSIVQSGEPIVVQGGKDKHDPAVREVKGVNDRVQLIRALRALKDRA